MLHILQMLSQISPLHIFVVVLEVIYWFWDFYFFVLSQKRKAKATEFYWCSLLFNSIYHDTFSWIENTRTLVFNWLFFEFKFWNIVYKFRHLKSRYANIWKSSKGRKHAGKRNVLELHSILKAKHKVTNVLSSSRMFFSLLRHSENNSVPSAVCTWSTPSEPLMLLSGGE